MRARPQKHTPVQCKCEAHMCVHMHAVDCVCVCLCVLCECIPHEDARRRRPPRRRPSYMSRCPERIHNTRDAAKFTPHASHPVGRAICIVANTHTLRSCDSNEIPFVCVRMRVVLYSARQIARCRVPSLSILAEPWVRIEYSDRCLLTDR